jgi:hypothetical protein
MSIPRMNVKMFILRFTRKCSKYTDEGKGDWIKPNEVIKEQQPARNLSATVRRFLQSTIVAN